MALGAAMCSKHIIIELLNLAGMAAEFGEHAAPASAVCTAWCSAALRNRWPRSALAQGHALIMAAINDRPFDVPAAVATIAKAIEERYLGPSTACIVHAATQRRIPFIRLNDGNLVQLGYGAAQRRIWSTENRYDQRHRHGHQRRQRPGQAAHQGLRHSRARWELVYSADQAWKRPSTWACP